MKIGIRKLHLRHTGLLRKMNIERPTLNIELGLSKHPKS
jgi:hypothetical protein